MALTESVDEIVENSNNPLLGKHDSWKRVRLGEIAEIQNGFAFKSAQFSKESGVPLIRIRDVVKDSTETLYTGEYDPDYMVQPGDLLVGMDGDFNCARWRGSPGLLNQRVCRIKLKSDVLHPKLIDYALPGYLKAINDKTSSVTVKHLSSKTVSQIPLPVPPPKQQELIVAEIEKQFSRLDEAVVSLKRVKANLKRYKAAVLKAAVEGKLTEEWRKQNPDVEPASKLLERILAERRAKWEEAELDKMKAKGNAPKNDKWKERYKEPAKLDLSKLPGLPGGWSWCRFEQLIENLRNGISKKPDQLDGLAILRISAVRPLLVDLGEVRYLAAKSREEFSSYELQDGDLLFTRYNGNPDFVGVCGVVRNIDTPTVHPDKIIRAQATNAASTQPEYLELALSAGESRSFIASKVRTTAGQSGISGTDIKNVPVPLPSAEEQKLIIDGAHASLSIIETLGSQIDFYLRRAERLKQTILADSFSG